MSCHGIHVSIWSVYLPLSLAVVVCPPTHLFPTHSPMFYIPVFGTKQILAEWMKLINVPYICAFPQPSVPLPQPPSGWLLLVKPSFKQCPFCHLGWAGIHLLASPVIFTRVAFIISLHNFLSTRLFSSQVVNSSRAKMGSDCHSKRSA